jgi:membrane protease YdiL (CAAX protease family)
MSELNPSTGDPLPEITDAPSAESAPAILQAAVSEPGAVLPVPPPAPLNPYSENPAWTAFDVFLIVLLLLASLVLSTSIAFGVAFFTQGHKTAVSAAELAKNPGPQIIVPAMTVSYGIVLAFMYLLVTRLRHRPFWEAVSWRWPSIAFVFLIGGGFLAVGLGLLGRLLPIPKSLPMDRFFRDPQSAYLMAFFGVLIAPLAEELLFRGFLYPVLDRWLGTALMTPRQIHRGALWLALMAAWGYASHRIPGMGSVLLAALFVIFLLGIFLFRTLKGQLETSLLLPGISILAWGLAARSVSDTMFLYASLAILAVTAGLAWLGFSTPLAESIAARAGRVLAIVFTAASFAMVHSDQLGRAWAPLLVLFLVGLTLTITRAVTRSVAPGYLVHVGYNLTLFGLMFVATDHFRHMERMTQ